MKPNLKHYPAWLREEICPKNPMKSILCDYRENEKALKELYELCRKSSVHRIAFVLMIESIRNKFDMYQMEKKIESLEERMYNMESDHRAL